MKQTHRKAIRSPEEVKRLRADRQRYQREKPTPEKLLSEGGHRDFMSLGELMFLHQVMSSLRHERERKGLTLAQVSKLSGIDQAALSRLETGNQSNPTLETVYRVATALGKSVKCVFEDDKQRSPKAKKKLAKV